MHPTSVYAIVITRRDGSSVLHGRCFAHELAARAEAEGLLDGEIAWLSRRYGMDEREDEFEIKPLTMWRLGSNDAVAMRGSDP